MKPRFDPRAGRSPGEGNGYPLQYSCLGNPMDGAWWATVHRVTESDRTEWLTLQGLRVCPVLKRGPQETLQHAPSHLSLPFSSLNKVGLGTLPSVPNPSQFLSPPSAWGSHMHIWWLLAHLLLIWHPATHPSAAYIISISVKNVPERGLCPWAVLYYWWFHLSYLISWAWSPPEFFENIETTPSALLQFPKEFPNPGNSCPYRSGQAADT